MLHKAWNLINFDVCRVQEEGRDSKSLRRKKRNQRKWFTLEPEEAKLLTATV
jgi:hypothetical protein